MSTFRTPVGPQSSKVYWRRRLVLALGLVAVIIIVILIVNRPGTNKPVPAGTTSGTPSAAAQTPAPKPGETVVCDPAMITLEPTTDAPSYEAGINPALSFSLKSTMTNPCTLAAGSDLQEFVITSGADRIWSSKDCQRDAVAATATLLPGVPLDATPIPWDRTRSATDTCEAERPQVGAGGATYRLDVTVGGVTSLASKAFLLN
ncbi:hypothetical protein [Salinibacterium sp.]|uniref:hypothetical protein n=1 Tax=Salinibacterium sp. TaxID=1915057 RepID=UPI00286A515F|nr:hypothetical protein [Salinibacterium sp.]